MPGAIPTPAISGEAATHTMGSEQRPHYHFVGIGGAGMSGIATVLLEMGYRITGSDLADSIVLQRLRGLGAEIAIGHSAENVDGADRLVYSTAIPEDNVELATAQDKGIRLFHRAEMLTELMSGRATIAVAGTHGKTTTTSMIGVAFTRAGLDPTLVVGGDIRQFGTNARLGQGPHLIMEACESDDSFLRFRGCSQVITNIEPDHLDRHGCVEKICESFEAFMGLVPPEGFLVVCADSERLMDVARRVGHSLTTYGLSPEAEVSAAEVRLEGCNSSFDLRLGGRSAGPVLLQVPGRHNIQNALGAIAASLKAEMGLEMIKAALGEFSGARRRFDLLGEVRGALVVDDYAHHPTEIVATLRAAREGFGRRIIAVFQPHLFSRTRLLLNDFAGAFREADEVIITDIYAAREAGQGGIDGHELYERVREEEPGKSVEYVANKDDIVPLIAERVGPGDMVLTLGAGDVRTVAERLVGPGRTPVAETGRPPL
jgi:UDP-N-acetylmuramate--alanine ligase